MSAPNTEETQQEDVWRCSSCNIEKKKIDFRPSIIQSAENLSICSAALQSRLEAEKIHSSTSRTQLTTLYRGSTDGLTAQSDCDASKAYDWKWIAFRDDRPRDCWKMAPKVNDCKDANNEPPWTQCAARAALPQVEVYPRDDTYTLDCEYLVAAHASAKQFDAETRRRGADWFHKQSTIYSKGHVASGLLEALQATGYTKLEAASRALSMFSEMFVLAVTGRKSDTLACYKGAGAIATVLLTDYVGSVEAGEIQALLAYTAVVARSDNIPAPSSTFLSNVIAHNTQWISDGKILVAQGGPSQPGQALSIDEYMRPRWSDGACDAYVGITMYSKAVARGYDSVGRFVQSLGRACPWAQAMHDTVFYYNDITDVVSDIALGEPMNLFVQARNVSAESLVWLATGLATLDYVGSMKCNDCHYHSDSEDWHYGSCVWYLAATRYCTAPQLWFTWAGGDTAPRWHELKWRTFTHGWGEGRWPFTESWHKSDAPVDYDIVEHLALRLGVDDAKAKRKIRSVTEGSPTVPDMVRSFILLAFPHETYVECIQETVLQFLRAHGYGTGSYTLSEARSDGAAYNLAHSSLLDRFFSELDMAERSKAVRLYCGLVSALCELTDLDIFGRIAALSAAALAHSNA